MTEEDRILKCSRLAKKMVDKIMEDSEILGMKGTGYRGTSDLENDIYVWLLDHAVLE